MNLLRNLLDRIDSWFRFPEFEHLDAMYDMWGDGDEEAR